MDFDQKVTHVLASAAAVGYNRGSDAVWKPLASRILVASYEAAILAAWENRMRNIDKPGSKKLFLTSIGGGVFGNRSEWINTAIKQACSKYWFLDLEVYLVTFGAGYGTHSFGRMEQRLLEFAKDVNKEVLKNQIESQSKN